MFNGKGISLYGQRFIGSDQAAVDLFGLRYSGLGNYEPQGLIPSDIPGVFFTPDGQIIIAQ
jgi:hypothetical protein